MPIYHSKRTAVLTEEQVEYVILNCLDPSEYAMFAAELGVSKSCIRGICEQRTWPDVWEKLRAEGKLRTGWRP